MTDNVLHKLRLGVDCSVLSDHIVNKNGELVLYSGESYNKLHEEEIFSLDDLKFLSVTDLEDVGLPHQDAVSLLQLTRV